MTFAASSFAEAAFASQSEQHISIAVSGFNNTVSLGAVTPAGIQNQNIAVSGLNISSALGTHSVSTSGNVAIAISGLSQGP